MKFLLELREDLVTALLFFQGVLVESDLNLRVCHGLKEETYVMSTIMLTIKDRDQSIVM